MESNRPRRVEFGIRSSKLAATAYAVHHAKAVYTFRDAARYGVPALVIWSLLVWAGRLRTLWTDGDGLGLGWRYTAEADLFGGPTLDVRRFLALLLSAIFIVTALWAIRSAVRLWRDGASDPFTCVTGAATVLALATVAAWPILTYLVLRSNESSGRQIAGQLSLAVLSIVLSLLVLTERFGGDETFVKAPN